jgi:FtsZ-interacting cell division protein ZipA
VDTMTVIIIAVVVLVLIALAVALMGRRKRRHAELAQEHRAEAREELTDLHQQRAVATAAEKRAETLRADAQQAEAAAREAREAEHAQAARAEDRVREADRLDPSVDHKSDDYSPGYDRVVGDERSSSTPVDPETGHPLEHDQRTGRPIDGGTHRA